MKKSAYRWLAIVAAMAVPFWATACADESGSYAEGAAEMSAAREDGGEHAGSEGTGEHAEGSGEHAMSEGGGEHGEAGEHGEHGSGEGEESGVQIGREETWDAIRNGARLVLSFDAASNAFVGTVENTTGQTLCAVRVEVHLSSGTELGPTERTDVPSGETTVVELPTAGEAFSTWTAHPEISACPGG